jgi:hypothetical protein
MGYSLRNARRRLDAQCTDGGQNEPGHGRNPLQTNLTQPGWIDLVVLTATNSEATASDALNASAQRFYRTVWLPWLAFPRGMPSFFLCRGDNAATKLCFLF